MYVWLRNGIGEFYQHRVWRVEDLEIVRYASYRVDWMFGSVHRVE